MCPGQQVWRMATASIDRCHPDFRTIAFRAAFCLLHCVILIAERTDSPAAGLMVDVGGVPS